MFFYKSLKQVERKNKPINKQMFYLFTQSTVHLHFSIKACEFHFFNMYESHLKLLTLKIDCIRYVLSESIHIIFHIVVIIIIMLLLHH